MSDAKTLEKLFLQAVKSYDIDFLRTVLNDEFPISTRLKKRKLFHFVCSSKSRMKCNLHSLTQKQNMIIYMLLDFGFDLEEKDKKGNTCLYYAVMEDNILLCDTLLQCGADMWANTEFNESIFEYVNKESTVEMKEIFGKYNPGLWNAVETENIYQVRKLVNLWCRTDLTKDDVTLKDLTLSTGNEDIISLILGIYESMKLIYHVFARNVNAVSKTLQRCQGRLRLNLRKMSDRGAPILYYLIQMADISCIELFIESGCHIYTLMQDECGFEMPVLFSALKKNISVSVVKAILPSNKPQQEELLYKMLYQGKSILEEALEQRVASECFNILIDRGGPLLLCERNQENQTVRDVALLLDQASYVKIIDENLFAWILHPWKYPGRRQQLALYGWDLESVETQLKESVYIGEYFSSFKPLQEKMKCIAEAVDNGDIKKFHEIKKYFSHFLEYGNFLWHGRVVGNGMPLLHQTVLYNRLEMAKIILSVKPENESIDSLFDQNHRTALHYAYASSSTKNIRNLITSYGCSEHVLDKVNKEPLDFRDMQDTPEMTALLDRLKTKAFSEPETDIWCKNEIGFYSNCQDGCSERSQEDSSNESDFSESSFEEEKQSFCVIS